MPEQVFLPPYDAHMDILGGVMELLSAMILHPLRGENGLLREEAVEMEKQSLCDSLKSLRNDTRTYAGNRLREIMCAGQPYGISIGGTVDEVMAITPEQVTAHHEALLRNTRMEVFYTGRASREEVMAAWQKGFGGWNPRPLSLSPTGVHMPPPVPRCVTEDMAVSQGKLCMGWSCGESYATLKDTPDTLAAYAVCNELFGVMQSSLLFRHVREERGLCYFCDSALDMTKGILWVSCGIHSDKRDEAEDAIIAQLTKLQAGEIDPADVELAKLSLLNSYRQIRDSQASMEVFSFCRLMNGTTDSPEEEMERICTVTVADVARVAATFKADTVFFLRGTAPDGEEDDPDDGMDPTYL
jgi:predicted Zn-dependent peptidase